MTRAAQIEKHLPATLTAPGLSEAEFLALAQEFPDSFLEYTADGTVLIMPPTDPDTGGRVAETLYQLIQWNKAHGHGKFCGADTGFLFPDGSRRSPDAAWYDAERWKGAQRPGTRFPVFAPEFVIEVRSPEQRRRPLREKMAEYVANGVQLAWLIDPVEHSVEIYRPNREPELLQQPASVAGEGPVEGFVLNLDGVL